MENYNQLKNKLLLYSNIKENDIKYKCINIDKKITMLRIRDSIVTIGKILEEDLKQQIYVVALKGGIGNLNKAVIAIQLDDKKIKLAGYAPEGLIKQNTVDKCFTKVTDVILK